MSTSSNTFEQIVSSRLSKRQFLQGSLSALAASLIACRSDVDAGKNEIVRADGSILTLSGLTFAPISASTDDRVRVPPGYTASVLAPWGDPIGSPAGAPPFAEDASGTAAEQLLQFGMHHDGMAFFELAHRRALIAVNHEYVDAGLLLDAPYDAENAEHVGKCMHAHGVTVYEVQRYRGQWRVVSCSPYARRITARTPMQLSGPAAGHALLQTAQDPRGELALGTFANCANGQTPWGTYLTCEENFNGYFKKATPGAAEQRYGIVAKTEMHDWSHVDPRFDLDREPNEANRFGWVVEIDPYVPLAAPKKRTALGRFKHENACVVTLSSGQIAVYMGDDERFEYIYRFVSTRPYCDGDRDILDDGTLSVAKLAADGSGEWLPLVYGEGALVAPAFTDQGDVLIRARNAADALGATKMDRPEWITRHPQSGELYCSLTNNGKRTEIDAANPRAANLHGHILRWRDDGDTFRWDIFVMAGDPASSVENLRGNIKGDLFSAPDGLAFDRDGMLWIMTDVSTSSLFHPVFNPAKTDWQAFGNNQLLAVDPLDGEVKRFLTGPVGAELTGFAMAPDKKTLFVNIQHPGEPLGGTAAVATDNDPAVPTKFSTWPYGSRPRSATLAIRRDDGGPIGS